MESADEPEVRAIFAECYPNRPVYPAMWYVAHPTLVAVDDDNGEEILGFLSFSIDMNNVMVLWDIALRASARGQGIGKKIFEEYLMIGRSLGYTFFGTVAPDNHPMVKLLTSHGFHACQRSHDNRIIYVNAGDPHAV